MGSRNESSTKRERILWLTFAIGFGLSLIGLEILFNPTLEFTAADFIDKLGLPIGIIANFVMITDYSLFVICGIGLIVMGLRALFRMRRKT